MKKRFFTILFIMACWTSYVDLTSGSLPAGQAAQPVKTVTEKAAVPYQRITVAPGDTLLSITEKINENEPSIERVLKDFAVLNPSVDPNHLQIGETYAFPNYDKTSVSSPASTAP
ncbi:LysM peptidoglycan-binding domain-containing protein [Sporolactobacillus laevolacticus]|jgi:LysM repeat protein|uniref:LysM peptidoglycan-binding domain-containing protein n=1 Tax=Sporolactobacillus laevolacticus TaxID=33018 RepID=UPI0025B59DB6|nr:LisM domain containing protein [Sporolactobacillus laevolacticus]MDN3955397.1 LisM domain containing protein [Sporolactobacillus laevolacticus]